MTLEATPVIKPATTTQACNEQNVVTPDVATQDGCEVLERIKSLTVQRGTAAVLEWQFTNAQGQPIDLTSCLNACGDGLVCDSSESSISVDEVDPCDEGGECYPCPPVSAEVKACPPCPGQPPQPQCGPVVRAREASFINGGDLVYECPLTVVDAGTGLVRWSVPKQLTSCPQVYKVEWAVNDECGCPLFVNESFMVVSSGLFGLTNVDDSRKGPPSLQEIRLVMRDSGPADNPLLQEVEFSDVEILYALVRPIRQFHELPPPLRTCVFTTKGFPWKEHWLKATVGHLYQSAAAFYRRNRLKHTSGGINLDDRNKENEYNNASERMLGEWLNFIQAKKVECNAAEAFGSVESTYGAFYSGL